MRSSDERALGTGHANARREHVVVRRLDAREDRVVDAAHDLGSHEAAGVGRRQLPGGAAIVVVRAIALERQQRRHLWSHLAAAQVFLGHTKPDQILRRQVDAPAAQIDGHVADDVGQLQRDAEALGIGQTPDVTVAEDLDADQTHRRRDSTAVFEQGVEGLVSRMREIHLDAVDQRFEPGARKVELTDERLQGNALRRTRRSAIGGVQLRPP